MPVSPGSDKLTPADAPPAPGSGPRARLHGWRHPSLLAAAGLSVGAGFAQFSASTALPDIAEAFGQTAADGSLAARAGLPVTVLGTGLAVIRLASLAAAPLTGLADRWGRRGVLLASAVGGLSVTVVAAASAGFWMFVALFAVARPLHTTTNNLAQVIAGETTTTEHRAQAMALITAGYGLGAGLSGLARAVLGESRGFRPLFLLAAVPLLAVAVLQRALEEPERFQRVRGARGRVRSLLRHPSAEVRRRLALLSAAAFGLTLITGPGNSFVFLYGESFLDMSRGQTAGILLAAGPVGLAGLVAGRALADRLGRVPSALATQLVITAAAVLTYSGGPALLVGGYVLTIFSASATAPAVGAMATELFPTSVRATVTGVLAAVGVVGAVAGLVLFGWVADLVGGFGLAAGALAVPVAALTLLYLGLPETRGLELEESAPEDPEPAAPPAGS